MILKTILYRQHPSIEGGKRVKALGGQTVELGAHKVYIDGEAVTLNWEYRYRSPGNTATGYYTKTQGINTDANTAVHPNHIRVGTFSGYCGSSSNAIEIGLTDFWYSYYYYVYGMGSDIYDTIDVDSPTYWAVCIDVDSKKTLDIENNWYYSNNKSTYTFTDK